MLVFDILAWAALETSTHWSQLFAGGFPEDGKASTLNIACYPSRSDRGVSTAVYAKHFYSTQHLKGNREAFSWSVRMIITTSSQKQCVYAELGYCGLARSSVLECWFVGESLCAGANASTSSSDVFEGSGGG